MRIQFRNNPMSGDPCFFDEEKNLFYGRIIGGLVWPSESPGAVVVVGQEDVFRPPRPAYVLREFEENTIGDLIKRCSYLTTELCVQDFFGRPDQLCLRYIDQFNAEARQKRLKPFYFRSAPAHDLPMNYHFNLLRDRLTLGSKTIHFPEGSQLPGQLLSVPENQPVNKDHHYPLVSALAYCTAALVESEEIDSRSRPRTAKYEYDVLNYDV